MNRRLMLSTLIAGSATAILVPTAGASASWCEDDPPVDIRTPTDYKLTVQVTNYALGDHDAALKIVHDNPVQPYITYTIDPVTPRGGNASGGKDAKDDKMATLNAAATPVPAAKVVSAPVIKQAWDVTIWVLIPGQPIPGDANEGRFKVKSVVSTGINATGEILAHAAGYSDDLMQLKFTITA